MTLLLCSRACLPDKPKRRANLVACLQGLRSNGVRVVFLSNSGDQDWFDVAFAGTGVEFYRWPGRQRAGTLPAIADALRCTPNDILVLAACAEDVQMAKNGGGVLLAAGWSSDPRVTELGIQVARKTSALTELVTLLSRWNTGWYYTAEAPTYHLRSLSDASSHRYTSMNQQQFGRAITGIVKGGGGGLPALLALAARSLESGGLGSVLERAAYGIFPSSSSANDDTDVLSDFGHRLRTTVSKVHFARRGAPLLIRHTPSAKRSAGGQGDHRTDPTEQLLTLHVNPAYRGKLNGRHIVVIDDCLTYGTSFGVAAALLRRAGAADVTGVALGKFGNRTLGYDIDITGDPFQPLPPAAIGHVGQVPLAAAVSQEAQRSLIDLLA